MWRKVYVIISGMLRYFWLLLLGFSLPLTAQTLRVTVSPETIYVGDAFQLTVMVDNASLEAVRYTFSMPTQVVSEGTQTRMVNQLRSSGKVYRLLPQAVGTCRLESVQAVTEKGETLTFDQPLEVVVKKVVPDTDVTLTMEVTPQVPLPGDEVVVKLIAKAPAIRNKETLISPFLTSDFFRGLQERAPRITFDGRMGEDAPLRLEQEPTMSRRTEGALMVWETELRYRAVRMGEQLFPAPILRDTRYLLNEKTQQLEEKRCIACGEPFTVRVSPPPEEGRPKSFCGAIGTLFEARAALDALNVKVGDPVKLTVTLLTDGLTESLRAPTLPPLKGFRVYGEPVRNHVEGGCAFVYNLRPIKNGCLEIPTLPISWFDKTTRTYRTAQTFAVPLYAHASAQLVLLDDDGEQKFSTLPPSLRLHTVSPSPTSPLHSKALWVLACGLLALAIRLLYRPCLTAWQCCKQVFGAHHPTARACAALKRAQTPSEMLQIVRDWAKNPSLTAEALRASLPQTEAARAVVDAVVALERAVYTGQAADASIRETLLHALPLCAQQMKQKTSSVGAWICGLLLFLPSLPVGQVDPFLYEQAETLSCAAITPQDYAHVANLWMTLAEECPSQDALLNGASCAILAQSPSLAVPLLQAYERLYGCDADCHQAYAAIAERIGKPLPWTRTVFSPHYRFSLSQRLEGGAFALGCLLLLCSVSWRRLRTLRWAVGVCVFALGCSILVSWVQHSRGMTFERLPEAEEETEVRDVA